MVYNVGVESTVGLLAAQRRRLSKQTLIIGQFVTDAGNPRLPAKPVIRARRESIKKARQQVRAFHCLGAWGHSKLSVPNIMPEKTLE